KRVKSANSRFERYLEKKPEKYLLQLYITGATPRSCQAVANLRKFCEENLEGLYQLEVVDIYQHPDLAREEQIIAAPTLIKKQPIPRKVMVGDLSNQELVKRCLGISSSSI
ncbi:MAG: circadian clock KaiB family protein, partial [Syntrophomonadaceae bacterium]|nr:circadian clock KaiB family protein [Syntrophomonadaceae bacterium]